jgi:hypothetical protein
MGLSGLKLTILAPANIARMASGSSTQSKGKRKATEEEPSTSQYIPFFIFRALLILSVGQSFYLDLCMITGVACLTGMQKNRTWRCGEQCPSAFNRFELPSWMLYQDVQLLWDSGLGRGESGYSL